MSDRTAQGQAARLAVDLEAYSLDDLPVAEYGRVASELREVSRALLTAAWRAGHTLRELRGQEPGKA